MTPEQRRKYAREYYWTHKDKMNEYNKRYYWENRERIRARNRKSSVTVLQGDEYVATKAIHPSTLMQARDNKFVVLANKILNGEAIIVRV